MRSLPPPRVTYKRRWLRIKRSVHLFFTTGSITDPGAFRLCKNNPNTLITKSRVKTYRRRNLLDKLRIRSTATNGFKTVKFAGKIAGRV